MASVHKHQKSKFWFAAFRGADGRQHFRSTQTTDRNQAIEVAIRYEREATTLSNFPDREAAAIAQELFVRAARLAQSGVFDEHVAREYLDSLLKLVGKPSMEAATIESVFNEWLGEKKVSASEGTYVSYAHTVANFLGFLGANSARAITSLTPSLIDGFRKSQMKEGKAPATVKLAIKTLCAALNRARRLGLILTNPAEAIEVGETDSLGKQPFTLPQVQSLFSHADDDWQGMILVGFNLGPRIGDAARMRWDQSNLEAGTISYRQQKTKRGAVAKPVTTVIMPELLVYLRQRRLRIPSAQWIFPSLANKPVSGKTGLSQDFINLIKAAGIANPPLKKNVSGKGRQFFALGFHSFRHTVVSTMENMGVSEEIRRLHVGHTSDAHAHYSHREVESIREAMKNYPSINS